MDARDLRAATVAGSAVVSDVEPHVNVWRFGSCVACGAPDTWVVVTVPKIATGERFPQFGKCESCGHEVDLSDQPPFMVEGVDSFGDGSVEPTDRGYTGGPVEPPRDPTIEWHRGCGDA